MIKRKEKLNGPYIAVATICERVLQEGNTPTLIRVIDTFSIEGEAPKMPPGLLQFVIFVMLKTGGSSTGKIKLGIVGHSPSGNEAVNETKDAPIAPGHAGGCSVQFEVKLLVSEPGEYWFDVLLNGTMISRIPMRIRYSKRKKGG
jgi:hypothetical protein